MTDHAYIIYADSSEVDPNEERAEGRRHFETHGPLLAAADLADAGEYLTAQYTVDHDIDPEEVLQNMYAWLDANFSWWRVMYHECSHFDENPKPCTWEQSWERGNVPDEVPNV